MNNYHYLFGPVPSRRFGRSLGIDLTPFKTCSFDCVFCQLGRTGQKTMIRKEYVPLADILIELESWMHSGIDADYITLSGSGEPTLNSAFGDVFKFLSKSSKVPAVLLTNGSMMHLQDVRDNSCYADIVKISLSAWDDHSIEWINRPHPEFRFDVMLEGIKRFRKQFSGELWMEVFLLLGMNSMTGQVEKIADQIQMLRPDRIHLNTVVRPPAEDFAAALNEDRLKELAKLFDPPAEVIAEFNAGNVGRIAINEKTILSVLKRRPCTIEQISKIFNMHINEMSKYLGDLLRNNQVYTVPEKTSMYYVANTRD